MISKNFFCSLFLILCFAGALVSYSEEAIPTCSVGAANGESPGLFKLEGKAYQIKDLPIAFKQSIYDADSQHFEQVKGIIDAVVLDIYLQDEAKKKKKTKEQIEQELFKAKKPTEKDAKAWYEKNKERIPYPYDKIKDEIIRIIESEEGRNKKAELLNKIKSKRQFSLILSAPEAPVAEIKSDNFPTKGNKGAKVKIIEFADYQCGHCKAASGILKKLTEKYKDTVQFVFMDFPLRAQGPSWDHAIAGHCAGEQGKFWEFHYMAFEEKGLTADTPVAFAGKLGLNVDQFKKCLSSPKPVEIVKASRAEGERIGVAGTPAIYINGQKMSDYAEEHLEKEIELAQKKK
ncbi:MAG: thioredoxin domain-containing protein [Oligoflexales bacterium]|nr:thioredoxin domain-containing protein [Oligoflexales bacterium]